MGNSKKQTVQGRILSHVTIGLVGAIVFLTVVNTIYMANTVVSEQNQKLELATRITAKEVDDWTNNMITVTEDMAGSLTAFGAVDDITVRGVIDRCALNHPEYYYVYFSDNLGNMHMARGVQYAAGKDPRTRPWYKAAESKGHSVVIDPYTSATSPDVMMATVASPVYWGSLLVGVVGVDADIQSIKDFMNTIDFETGSYGFLLDSKGDIITHPNEEYTPTADSVTNVADVMPELHEAMGVEKNGIFYGTDYRNIEMVYSVVSLENSGWKVVVAYPRKNVATHVYKVISISVFVALVCLLLTFLDITYVVKRTLKPISKMTPALENIIRGDFTTKLDFATADDEIGDLQNTMSMLIADLSDIIELEKHVLGEMERGNLAVDDIDELPGDLNEISKAVNSIKERFNDIISDIQFSAINLQSYAMGINETSDIEEMKMIFEELSAEANVLMDKTSKFITK